MDTHSYRARLENVLSGTGVTIDGSDPWDIQVRDPRFFRRVLTEGELGGVPGGYRRVTSREVSTWSCR